MIRIRGAGGKAGGARVPLELADTLRSVSYAKIVHLLSEGPIAGLVDANGDVCVNAYVDAQRTPVHGSLPNTYIVTPGSSGYTPSTHFPLIITGDGSGATGYAASDATGTITSVVIQTGGSNYTTANVGIIPSIGKAVFLDNVPLQRTDAAMNFNFDGFTLDHRLGTQDQTPMAGFTDAETPITDSTVPLSQKTGSVFVDIPEDILADHVLLGLSVDALETQSPTTGDVTGATVNIDVNVVHTYQVNGISRSDTKFLIRVTFSSKFSSKYIRSVQVELPKVAEATNDTYQLQFTRITADSTTQYLKNSTNIEYVIAATDSPFRYPNCALVGININAAQFGSLPTCAFRTRGRAVQVPTNYFPAKTRRKDGSVRLSGEYNRDPLTGSEVIDGVTGIRADQEWDGTFYSAWTSCPPWVLYDLATNTRYGAGRYIKSIDKWTLYTIARYCDELVDDGFGSIEPRFTCNLFLQTQEEAYKVFTKICTIFRGMLAFRQGTVFVSQDAPKPPRMLFTNANVVDGIFNYSGAAGKVRHTVATVQYNDPNDHFKLKYEYVEDIASVIQFGINDAQITEVGCTSRGQARRAGNYYLFTERQGRAVGFKTGMDVTPLAPGDVFHVADNDQEGISCGGRIRKISTDRKTVYADRPFKTTQAVTVILAVPAAVIDPNDVATSSDIAGIGMPQITSIPVLALGLDEQGFATFSFTDPIDERVFVGALFGVEYNSVDPVEFMLITKAEIGPGQYEISAVEYHRQKFDVIERGYAFETEPIDDNTHMVNAETPASLDLVIERVQLNGAEVLKINASWVPGSDSSYGVPTGYNVYVRKGLGNWAFYGNSKVSQLDIIVPAPDEYSVQVTSIGLNQQESGPIEASITITDLHPDVLANEQVTGLELYNQGNSPTFNALDASFDWRINSPVNSYEIGAEPNGASSGGNSPGFQGYEIQIIDPNSVYQLPDPVTGDPVATFTNDLIRSELVSDNHYVLSYSKNRALVNGPYRDFIFKVRTKVGNTYSAFQEIRVSNDVPPVPSPVTVTISGGFISIKFPSTQTSDFAGYRVWLGGVTGFNPTLLAPIFEGPAKDVILPLAVNTAYYLRWAEFDTFSLNYVRTRADGSKVLDSNISAEYKVVGALNNTNKILDIL